jgi:STE24 endopeptidase
LILALWFLVATGLGGRIVRAVSCVSSQNWLQGLVVISAWLLILVLLELPASLVAHHVNLRYGISVEGWGAWWVDWLKSLALNLVVGIFVLSVLYAMLRRLPRRWWVAFWAFTVVIVVIGTYIAPLVVDPLFNHFEPLAQTDPALVQKLEEVADRGGLQIPKGRIFLMDASRRYTSPNAYVTGIGSSKRIVVWDTTLKEESPSEILFTYGHEQGHYVLHHILKGIAFAAAMFFIIYWFGSRLLVWLVRCKGAVWKIDAVSDWSSLGLVLLLVSVLSFFTEPLANSFSRMIEHQADVYGQEVIHGLVPDPRATVVQSFCSDAVLWLDNPSPNHFVEFWTYSHPSTEERAEFAAQYDPWQPGHRPRYFSRSH